MPRTTLSSRLWISLRIVVLSLFVLAVFWVVAFLLGMLVGSLQGHPVTGGGLLPRCVLCGLIAGLFVAVFHIKKEVVQLPVIDRQAFTFRVGTHLQDLGYTVVQETEERLTFRPSFQAFLFGTSIEVRLTDGAATISGPRIYLEMLRRRLRVESHIERTASGQRRRPGERLLRRVQITLRASPEQWQQIHDEVLDVLGQADAELICQIDILAQSETGIREQTIDALAGGWLKQEELQARIQKERLSCPAACRSA